MLFAFLWVSIWAIAKPVLVLLLTTLAGSFTFTARDKKRTELYNTLTDDILYALLFERPGWTWTKDAQEIKTALVQAILANSRLTNNREIAERLAKAAIARASAIMANK